MLYYSMLYHFFKRIWGDASRGSDENKERNAGEGCCPMGKMREIRDQPERTEDEGAQSGGRERRKGERVRSGEEKGRETGCGKPVTREKLDTIFSGGLHRISSQSRPNHHSQSSSNPSFFHFHQKLEGIWWWFGEKPTRGAAPFLFEIQQT